MERPVEGFCGFLDCLEGIEEKGGVYGVGAWKVGEIEKQAPSIKSIRNGTANLNRFEKADVKSLPYG